jgi:hypothetical protein
MPSLSETLDALSQTFAEDVLVLARKASVDEIISGEEPVKGPEPPPGLPSTIPPKRMGPAMIDSVASLITRYVKSQPGDTGRSDSKGVRDPQEQMGDTLALALEKKGLSKKGEKRATTYWVDG